MKAQSLAGRSATCTTPRALRAAALTAVPSGAVRPSSARRMVVSAAQPQNSQATTTLAQKQYSCALLFDCDGVIVETEELHRKAYNASFIDYGLTINGEPVVWSTEYYDKLQNTVGGGKPKMKWHFNKFGWPATKFGPVPATEEEKNKLVDELQDNKTVHYTRIVEQAAEARPGVLALMDEGLAREDVAMCICSAATKEGFVKVVDSVVGKARLERFDIILAGDDVTKKKPDPQIYNTARERLGLPANRCVVVEDSLVGLRAAVGAGMHCIITPTESTASADFCGEGAAAVLSTLAGTGPDGKPYQVTINDIFSKICDDRGCQLVPDIRLSDKNDECPIPWAPGSWDDRA